ncbi:hypothetical protein Tcan_02134, partial [Toxocara canis]
SEANIGPVLMAACKMESPGLLRKCALLLLAPHTQLSVFVRLSLLDRCFLHDLLEPCLQMIHRPEHLIEMTFQQTCKFFTSLHHRCPLLLHPSPSLQFFFCYMKE